jgi:hypothetical protein
VLQSGEELYVSWYSNWSQLSYGWNPNFWLGLMGGYVALSIICGLLHVYLVQKDKEER